MTLCHSRPTRAAVLLSALALGACSSSSSGISTSSLLSTSKPAPVEDSTSRALQVATTSARAARCGYNFDAQKLKASYIAYESAQGGTPEQIAKLDKAYDFTRSTVAGKIGPVEDYCSDDQTATIKSDLSRHLAGDFTPAKRAAEAGAFDWLASKSESKKWNPEDALYPSGQRK